MSKVERLVTHLENILRSKIPARHWAKLPPKVQKAFDAYKTMERIPYIETLKNRIRELDFATSGIKDFKNRECCERVRALWESRHVQPYTNHQGSIHDAEGWFGQIERYRMIPDAQLAATLERELRQKWDFARPGYRASTIRLFKDDPTKLRQEVIEQTQAVINLEFHNISLGFLSASTIKNDLKATTPPDEPLEHAQFLGRYVHIVNFALERQKYRKEDTSDVSSLLDALNKQRVELHMADQRQRAAAALAMIPPQRENLISAHRI